MDLLCAIFLPGILFVQSWIHQNNVLSLFKVNHKYTRTTSVDVILVSLLLTLDRFHKLFRQFHSLILNKQMPAGFVNSVFDQSTCKE